MILAWRGDSWIAIRSVVCCAWCSSHLCRGKLPMRCVVCCPWAVMVFPLFHRRGKHFGKRFDRSCPPDIGSHFGRRSHFSSFVEAVVRLKASRSRASAPRQRWAPRRPPRRPWPLLHRRGRPRRPRGQSHRRPPRRPMPLLHRRRPTCRPSGSPPTISVSTRNSRARRHRKRTSSRINSTRTWRTSATPESR